MYLTMSQVLMALGLYPSTRVDSSLFLSLSCGTGLCYSLLPSYTFHSADVSLARPTSEFSAREVIIDISSSSFLFLAASILLLSAGSLFYNHSYFTKVVEEDRGSSSTGRLLLRPWAMTPLLKSTLLPSN